jgi:hypothetical protein
MINLLDSFRNDGFFVATRFGLPRFHAGRLPELNPFTVSVAETLGVFSESLR